MITVDGLAILGGSRTGLTDGTVNGNFTLPLLTDTSIAGQNVAFKAGDIAFCCAFAHSADGTSPALVTPAGWTNIINQNFVTGAAKGARFATFYKILSAADIGGTFTTMFGTVAGRSRAIIQQFAMSRPVQSIVNTANDNKSGDTDITAVSLNPTALVGNVLLWGAAHGQLDIADADMNWMPDVGANGPYFTSDNPPGSSYLNNVIGTPSVTRSGYNYYPFGTNPAITSLDIPDMGEFSAMTLSSFILS